MRWGRRGWRGGWRRYRRRRTRARTSPPLPRVPCRPSRSRAPPRSARRRLGTGSDFKRASAGGVRGRHPSGATAINARTRRRRIAPCTADSEAVRRGVGEGCPGCGKCLPRRRDRGSCEVLRACARCATSCPGVLNRLCSARTSAVEAERVRRRLGRLRFLVLAAREEGGEDGNRPKRRGEGRAPWRVRGRALSFEPRNG